MADIFGFFYIFDWEGRQLPREQKAEKYDFSFKEKK